MTLSTRILSDSSVWYDNLVIYLFVLCSPYLDMIYSEVIAIGHVELVQVLTVFRSGV